MGRHNCNSVATQLILLLATVQTVPLPASTLDPQVPSSHHSRIPLAADSDLEKNIGFENDKLTSVYIEEHRQTVVYEDGPVWSNSPDIEEPFYPTTASSDHLLNRDSSTENIPITSISISNDELQTKTHLFNYFGKSHIENENPIELTSQYFSDHSPQSSDIVQNYNIDKSEDSQDVYTANAESASVQEKASSAEEIYSSTETHFISTTPKIVDNSVIINNHESSNSEQWKESPNTESYSPSDKVSNLNSISTSVRKGNQRLVIRDLSNLSEPVLSSVVASQGNNSSSIDDASRPNPRTSKAIGSFRNFSSSVDGKQRHIFSPDKFEGSEKLVHSVDDKENQTILQSDDLKIPDTQINNTGVTQTKSNITQSSLQNNTKTFNNETKSEIMRNQKLPLESESSKLAPELSNKSVHSINITSLRKIQIMNRTGQPILLPISSTQNISNSSTVDLSKSVPTQLLSSESPVPVDSDLSQRFTTLSDTEESGNLTPAHSHEFIGRSASLSHDTETTVEPSIAPVSKSRLAASPQDVPTTGLDAASITGIALGIVVFAGLTGAVSFVLYRRRYLNKPQTLNDKCSNPDSSGYIDDSTLRDNSEEMYSLDNDSFLNSLEAMTIQNYWTDNETCWRQNHP